MVEAWSVEDGRHHDDDQHGDAGASRADIATSMQRVTNGDVAAERHVDC